MTKTSIKNYEEIDYQDAENDMITFDYAGHTFTLNPDDIHQVSADDDGSVVFDPRTILDVDEDNQILFIEK